MKHIISTQSLSQKALLCTVVIGLISCGGTGQDDGRALELNQEFSGVTIDGHLARATVFIDTDNNGARDPWEPFAFTDNDGYYSYNPLTDTQYCADNTAAEQQIYCLRATTTAQNVVLRIDGGYDVLTGEPFLGQLSRRIDTSSGESLPDMVISPLTSILTNANDAETETILSALGLETSDLNTDYLNSDGNGNIDAEIFNVALKVHKTVTILSDHLMDTYTNIGEEMGTPNDATASIYSELAAQILSSTGGTTLDQVLQNDTALAAVLDRTEEDLRAIYEDREFTLPADQNASSSEGDFDRVIQIVNDLPAVIDEAIPPASTDLDRADATGGARLVETITIKFIEENNGNDVTLDNAITFITTPENETLIDSLVMGLSGDNADVRGLVNNDFSGSDFDSEEEILGASSLPEDVIPFTEIGAMSYRVSDLDLGTAPNDLQDSEVEFYFEGTASALSGSYTACVKFIDEANSNGELGEGNTRGELVNGFWSLLGATENDQISYSLLITIEFLGATYQAIVKPYGTDMINDTEYHVIRSDTDGDFRNWYSENGLVPYETVPTSNAECAASLPSRVGL